MTRYLVTTTRPKVGMKSFLRCSGGFLAIVTALAFAGTVQAQMMDAGNMTKF